MVSLRSYVETLLQMHTEAHEKEHALMRLALEKAESDLNRRLEAMNEFRSQLTRESATFATKDDIEQRLDSLEGRLHSEIVGARTERESEIQGHNDRLTVLEKWQANMTGRLAIVAIGLTVGLTLMTLFIDFVLGHVTF